MNRRDILSLLPTLLIPIPFALRANGCVDCGVTDEEAPGLPFYSANSTHEKQRYICDPCFNIARKNGSLSRFCGYQACEVCDLLGSGGVYDKSSGYEYICWNCYDVLKTSSGEA